jgi:hypothetical protein
LPFVKEGAEREFHSLTRQVALHRPLALAAAPADEIALVTSTELTSPGAQRTASNVGEPSVAIHDQVVFYTGNWYAAVSSDGGKTFSYLDPATVFQAADPPNSHYCCDQVVNYIPQIDTFVWLLQYGPDTGDNIQRLAFASSANVVQGRWRLFDVTTQSLGVPGAFLDFPDLAVGAGALYMTTNVFAGGKVGAAVVRIPFAGIQGGHPIAQRFVTMTSDSLRVAQHCGTTAFFAAHEDTSTLRLFAWDEGKDAPTSTTIGVARWIGGQGYQSRTPDGRRWLDRADARITGATVAGKELWFAWTVDRGSNLRPRPFVQIARIDSTNLTLIENVNIFHPDAAIAYGALSANASGEVGISYMIGGGTLFPSHMVGILTATRKDILVAASDRGPLPDPQTGKFEWGDYLTVRRAYPDQQLFAATGYVLKGKQDGDNLDATPRFVLFGRAADALALGKAPGGGGSGGGAMVPGGSVGSSDAAGAGEPLRGVDLLPAVSPSVAAQIKALARIAGDPQALAEAAPAPELATSPGVERWPVKTGTDPEAALVGKNAVGGQSLGAGIVEATVEELIGMPRPPDMLPVTSDFPSYQTRRAHPVETTIWRIEAEIIALKLEADGDYHLVLQGASGETMIGEIPTPRPPFVGTSSPWLADMQAARQAIDDRLVSHLSPAGFAPMGDKLVPRAALSVQPPVTLRLPESFETPLDQQASAAPTFKTKITPTRARITGVGFFDNVHGQMGVAQANGIELHPVLKVEWL